MIPPKYWSPTRKLMLLGAMAGGKTVEATALGNPLTFITDVSKPLKSLLIPFSPIQSGTGDPSPENIRPILPWNGLTVFCGGKNLLNENGTIYNRTIGGETWTISSSEKTLAFKGKPNTQYDVSIFNDESPIFRMCTIDKDPSEVTEERYPITNYKSPIRSSGHTTITTGEENIWIIVQASGVYITNRNAELMIVAGEGKPSAYEPYHPITETDIVFPSPVYGGTLDVVSGVLTVEWAMVVKKFSECEFGKTFEETGLASGHIDFPVGVVQCTSARDYGEKTLCNICNVIYWGNSTHSPAHYYINTQSRAWLALPGDMDGNTQIEICAKLAEPYTVQLTQEQITALKGENTIWSDADGQMTAVYLKKG